MVYGRFLSKVFMVFINKQHTSTYHRKKKTHSFGISTMKPEEFSGNPMKSSFLWGKSPFFIGKSH